jgi:hypothetical protein
MATVDGFRIVKATSRHTVFEKREAGPSGTGTEFLQVRVSCLTGSGWEGVTLPGRLVEAGTPWNG